MQKLNRAEVGSWFMSTGSVFVYLLLVQVPAYFRSTNSCYSSYTCPKLLIIVYSC